MMLTVVEHVTDESSNPIGVFLADDHEGIAKFIEQRKETDRKLEEFRDKRNTFTREWHTKNPVPRLPEMKPLPPWKSKVQGEKMPTEVRTEREKIADENRMMREKFEEEFILPWVEQEKAAIEDYLVSEGFSRKELEFYESLTGSTDCDYRTTDLPSRGQLSEIFQEFEEE